MNICSYTSCVCSMRYRCSNVISLCKPALCEALNLESRDECKQSGERAALYSMKAGGDVCDSSSDIKNARGSKLGEDSDNILMWIYNLAVKI